MVSIPGWGTKSSHAFRHSQISIYVSNLPLILYKYKKAISGVRSKYMQDYNESKRISKYSEEKQFNNLLSS